MNTEEQSAYEAIKTFLNVTNNIDFEGESITPATKTAIGKMQSTGKELLEYYDLTPPSN